MKAITIIEKITTKSGETVRVQAIKTIGGCISKARAFEYVKKAATAVAASLMQAGCYSVLLSHDNEMVTITTYNAGWSCGKLYNPIDVTTQQMMVREYWWVAGALTNEQIEVIKNNFKNTAI